MRIRLVLSLFLALPMFTAAHAEDFQIKDRDVVGLIAALQKSNQTGGPHRIQLAPGGIYTLQSATSAGLGLPALRSDIVIEGNGAEIRRYAASRMALIEVAAEARVVIRNLTLAEGSQGTLRNRGTLLLERVAIVDSFHPDADAIVTNFGHLTLRDSLLGWNQVSVSDGDTGLIENHGRLSVQRSRIVGNSASRAPKQRGDAAAVLNTGEFVANAIEFEANALIDPFGGMAFRAVRNLGQGRADGVSSQQMIADGFDLP
ncbi:MAG: hypothetical protein ACK5PG_05085 [Lysobacterales bacterium]|jgi:hypothetical protein